MNKKITLVYVFLIIFVVISIFATLYYPDTNSIPENNQVVCTADAKMCPDGSYVGRTGPKCEFSPCPDVSQNEAKINQKIVVGGVSITPLKVISDSRCPKEVQCVWAGTLVVKVRLEKEGGVQEADLEIGKPITFVGDRVSLENVLPDKTQSEILSSEYRFTFSVTSSSSGIRSKILGRVTISPTCPVERIPPDPNCAPKGFGTTVSVTQGSKSIILAEVKTDKGGNYSLELPPGKYTLNIFHGKTFPSCPHIDIVVISGKNQKVDIDCDSGIR